MFKIWIICNVYNWIVLLWSRSTYPNTLTVGLLVIKNTNFIRPSGWIKIGDVDWGTMVYLRGSSECCAVPCASTSNVIGWAETNVFTYVWDSPKVAYQLHHCRTNEHLLRARIKSFDCYITVYVYIWREVESFFSTLTYKVT